MLEKATLCALVILSAAVQAFAQPCTANALSVDDAPSEVRTLDGRLIYHNGIRRWFELRLDHPQCQQNSIQLTWAKDDWTPLETLRGCRVRSTGVMDYTGTGYYSLPIYQDAQEITPVGNCVRKPPLPGDFEAKPDEAIRDYRVDMRFDYHAGDHPVVFRISSSGKDLRPWQAYASYWLTGGFVLYGNCGEGFVVDKVFGTPQAKPSHFDSSAAMFDPERAARSGVQKLHLGWTCVRERQ